MMVDAQQSQSRSRFPRPPQNPARWPQTHRIPWRWHISCIGNHGGAYVGCITKLSGENRRSGWPEALLKRAPPSHDPVLQMTSVNLPRHWYRIRMRLSTTLRARFPNGTIARSIECLVEDSGR